MAAREVEGLRRMIDEVDARIIRLLEERMELCRRIGLTKKAESLPVRDEAREREVLARAGRFRGVFAEIIRLCVQEQG